MGKEDNDLRLDSLISLNVVIFGIKLCELHVHITCNCACHIITIEGGMVFLNGVNVIMITVC